MTRGLEIATGFKYTLCLITRCTLLFNKLLDVPFSDRDSFLCLLRLDGLVLDELSFGIDDENFIKTEGLLLATNKGILVAFYCVGTPKIGATDGNTFRCSIMDNSQRLFSLIFYG